MNASNRQAAIAALVILLGFGLGAYFMPSMMLAIGEVSTLAAAIVAVAFVLSFFAIFWLRGRGR